MIEVKNLVKKFGDHTAVDNLSFRVEKGQIYGFLGPNGAGKSTTMNMITGYLAPTEGSVTIDGFDILEEPEKAKKCIGYLPEIPPLYPEMTVEEYLKFAAELKKVPKEERRSMIEEVMHRTQLFDVEKRLIKNLSKGYKQRVGIAQALLGYPEVIILDEPTIGLDPKQIIEIRELIHSLSEKHTVILSSHILSEISAVCDYVMIIAHGKLVASDTPANLSKKLAGANALLLTLRADGDAVSQALKEMTAVKSFECVESEEPGCVDVKIETLEERDIREQLFYVMADRKLPIVMMQAKKATLEDVFLELTAEDPAIGGQEKKRFRGLRKPQESTAGDMAELSWEEGESDESMQPKEKEGADDAGDL